MKISYAITVCNEIDEITRLLNFLQLHINEDDEIVIQYDLDSVTPEVLEYLKIMEKLHENHIVVGFPLNNDFASFKNNLKSHCSGIYIMQIDADEIPHEFLIENLNTILERNPVDLLFVPRINTIDGLTDEDIKKWGWNLNEKGWVNWADYQSRIYKNTDDITWMGSVHERITGYSTVSNLPALEEWSLYHHKSIEKQKSQIDFYQIINENLKEKN